MIKLNQLIFKYFNPYVQILSTVSIVRILIIVCFIMKKSKKQCIDNNSIL